MQYSCWINYEYFSSCCRRSWDKTALTQLKSLYSLMVLTPFGLMKFREYGMFISDLCRSIIDELNNTHTTKFALVDMNSSKIISISSVFFTRAKRIRSSLGWSLAARSRLPGAARPTCLCTDRGAFARSVDTINHKQLLKKHNKQTNNNNNEERTGGASSCLVEGADVARSVEVVVGQLVLGREQVLVALEATMVHGELRVVAVAAGKVAAARVQALRRVEHLLAIVVEVLARRVGERLAVLSANGGHVAPVSGHHRRRIVRRIVGGDQCAG